MGRIGRKVLLFAARRSTSRRPGGRDCCAFFEPRSTLLTFACLDFFKFTIRHFFEVMWLEYEPEWEKRLPQLLHWNGFSPL